MRHFVEVTKLGNLSNQCEIIYPGKKTFWLYRRNWKLTYEEFICETYYIYKKKNLYMQNIKRNFNLYYICIFRHAVLRHLSYTLCWYTNLCENYLNFCLKHVYGPISHGHLNDIRTLPVSNNPLWSHTSKLIWNNIHCARTYSLFVFRRGLKFLIIERNYF